MFRGRTKPGFFLFWAAACAAWTLTWLVVDFVLVPELLRVPPLRLVAIGTATALAPVLLLYVGRAVLALGARGISFSQDRVARLRGALRGGGVRAGDPSQRRAPAALGDEYQSSAGPL